MEPLTTANAETDINDLKSRLLRETTRVVRRRRYVRRAAMVALCAGCYVAGLLTVSVVQSHDAPPAAGDTVAEMPKTPPSVDKDSQRTNNTAPQTVSKSRQAQQPDQKHASAVVKSAPQPREKKSRFVSLRELGDHYLLEKLDPAGAARCYEMALRYATPEEVERNPDEGTWLFRALKQDHNWETDDARQQG